VGLVREGYKYVATKTTPIGPPTEQLFALGAEEDDLAPHDPARLARMRFRIQEILADVKRVSEERQRQLTPEEREQMDRLGYGGGGR